MLLGQLSSLFSISVKPECFLLFNVDPDTRLPLNPVRGNETVFAISGDFLIAYNRLEGFFFSLLFYSLKSYLFFLIPFVLFSLLLVRCVISPLVCRLVSPLLSHPSSVIAYLNFLSWKVVTGALSWCTELSLRRTPMRFPWPLCTCGPLDTRF